MRQFYQNCFPKDRREKVEAIKTELTREAKELFQIIWTGKEYRIESKDYKEDGFSKAFKLVNKFESKLVKKIEELRSLECPGPTTWYVHHTNYTKYSSGRKIHFSEDIVNNTWNRCQMGDPTSFSMMALLLRDRKVSYALKLKNKKPFKDVEFSMKLLRRLADLGEPIALETLNVALVYNKIGSDKCEIKLDFTNEERIEGLCRIARQTEWSQMFSFSLILDVRGFSEEADPSLSPERCLKIYQEFIDNEVGFNESVTSFYKHNGGHQLDAGIPLEKRLNILTSRANKGDRRANSILVQAYIRGSLNEYGDRAPLKLSDEERWERLRALEKNDPALWRHYVASIYRDRIREDNLLTVDLPEKERYQWIHDHAIKDGSTGYQAIEALKWDGTKLGFVTKKQKFEFLHNLYNAGYKHAAEEIVKIVENSTNWLEEFVISDIEMFEKIKVLALDGNVEAGKLLATIIHYAKHGRRISYFNNYLRVKEVEIPEFSYDSEDLAKVAWFQSEVNILEFIRMNHGYLEGILCNLISLRETINWIHP